MKEFKQYFYTASQAVVFYEWLITAKQGIAFLVSMDDCQVSWQASTDNE